MRKQKRESRWTMVYWTPENKAYYIRLVPRFMNLEATGFPHGLSITGNTYATQEEAEKDADIFDTFFDALAAKIIQDNKDEVQYFGR